MAYRSHTHAEHVEVSSDPGLVGEVIAQFADPLAFYRELIQNAIDAGSPAIEVEITYDEAAARARVAVRDRGCGMTRETIEEQLLVLFRSTKERDDSKIGKFGIGFASVLAPAPELVTVHSARDGRRLALHLRRDLTYRLFDAGSATQPGTTVELELAIPADELAAFVRRSRAALVRWCRHATVPIQLTTPRRGRAPNVARIDRPLALEGALVEVRRTADGGQLTAVVGLKAGAKPYAGFFNHGLMLYETTEPLAGRRAVVIQDARLGHTLSRDNVRRDAAFHRALALARALDGELATAVIRELAAAAEHVAEHPRYHELLGAARAAGLPLPDERWIVPLTDEVGGRRAIAVSELPSRAWRAPLPSPLTALLAARGVPVVRTGGDGDAHAWLEPARRRFAAVEYELTSVTPVEPTPHDLVLLDELAAIFRVTGRPPPRLALATLAGAAGAALAIAAGPGDAVHAARDGDGDAYAVDRAATERSPFALLRRPPLVLSAEHRAVVAARHADDPVVAASHLARAVLLHYKRLDVARSAAIFERLARRLVGAA